MQFIITKQGTRIIVASDEYTFAFSSIRIANENVEATIKITNQTRTLFIGKVNLMDINKRWHLAKHLTLLDAKIRWEEMLTIVFTYVLNELLKREPLQRLNYSEKIQNHYFMYPLLAEPFTLIFAPGGSGKSYLALHISIVVQNAISSFFDIEKAVNVLYLDWETSREDIEKRFTKLAARYIEIKPPFYRNLAFPLKYEIDNITNDILENDIKLLIIDSVVPALGGNINDAAVVAEFFAMLKQLYNLNSTRSLLLTHVSKSDKQNETGNASAIGSVYFENYPRLVWELKSFNTTNKLNIELRPTKSNISWPQPFAVEFIFDGDVILTNEYEIDNNNDLEIIILNVLRNNNEVKLKELKDILAENNINVSYEELRRILKKLVKENKIRSASKGYYQFVNDDEPPF